MRLLMLLTPIPSCSRCTISSLKCLNSPASSSGCHELLSHSFRLPMENQLAGFCLRFYTPLSTVVLQVFFVFFYLFSVIQYCSVAYESQQVSFLRQSFSIFVLFKIAHNSWVLITFCTSALLKLRPKALYECDYYINYVCSFFHILVVFSLCIRQQHIIQSSGTHINGLAFPSLGN